jgi:phosphatidylinositol glycan class U
MEVFDRFIPYFLFVLHVHPLIYIIPISFRLSHRPQAFAVALVGILTLFQAYPTLGDFGLFLSLFSMHPKTFMSEYFNLRKKNKKQKTKKKIDTKFKICVCHVVIKNGFAYALGIAVATCLFPVMWFLWLYAASGNANFFYNQTLVYQIFHSQMITSFVGAAMKRDKQLQLFRKHFHAISSPSPTNSTKTVSSNSSNSSTTSTTINSSAIQRAEQTISKAKVE